MADEFFDKVTVGFEEATHLTLLAVVEVHFEPTLVAFADLRGWNDFFSFKKVAFVFGACEEFLGVGFVKITMQNDTVTFDYLIAGVREAIGQVAVVCDDEKTFAVFIEASCAKKAQAL